MRLALAAALAAPLLSLALPAAGAITACVSLKVQGNDLSCETANPAYPNHAEAIAVTTNLIRPIGSGGLPGGNRQHSPIRITEVLDRCTPILADALVRNLEVDAVIKFVRAMGDGTLQHFFTIEVRGGRLAGHSLVLPDTLDPSASGLPPLEHLSLVFQTIT